MTAMADDWRQRLRQKITGWGGGMCVCVWGGGGGGVEIIDKINEKTPCRTHSRSMPLSGRRNSWGGIIRPSPWLLTSATTPQLRKKMPPLPVLLATASIEHDSGAKGTTRAQGVWGGKGPHTPHRRCHLLMRGPLTPPLPLLLGRGEGLNLIK